MGKSFGAFVTTNGRRLVMDNDIAWRAGFARFAGEEVVITIHKRRATERPAEPVLPRRRGEDTGRAFGV